MKSKKNIIIALLAVLIIARIVIVFFEKKAAADLASAPVVNHKDVQKLNPDATLSKTPAEAVTSQNGKSDVCQSMRSHYSNLVEVHKMDKTSIRFVNIHKKVEGVVYRTRFFYKDSSENEIPTYLAYKEDQTEEEHLIETSPYKKGPQFLKIEKSEGQVLYTEEGVNVGVDQDLFLHYENNELKDLQGVSPDKTAKDFIECRY